MTQSTHTTDTGPAPQGAGLPSDPRPLWDRAAATASAVVDGIEPGQLGAPTPCAEFDVGDLLGHLLSVVERVAAMARGENPMAGPPAERVTDLDGFRDRWRAAVADCHRAWSDDAALSVPVVLPWQQGTGAELLAGYLNEITVHTWDLSRATGQDTAAGWDPDVLAVAGTAIRAVLPADGRAAAFAAVRDAMPPGARAFGDPFAEVVDVPDDAPAIDRLVAYNGRRP